MRGLEWSVSAPPPEFNYAVLPHFFGRDPFFDDKRKAGSYAPPTSYEHIELPRNSVTGPAIGIADAALAFGVVCYIWWLAILCSIGIIAAVIARSFARGVHRTIPAAEIARTDRRWRPAIAVARPIPRLIEITTANEGLAEVPV